MMTNVRGCPLIRTCISFCDALDATLPMFWIVKWTVDSEVKKRSTGTKSARAATPPGGWPLDVACQRSESLKTR